MRHENSMFLEIEEFSLASNLSIWSHFIKENDLLFMRNLPSKFCWVYPDITSNKGFFKTFRIIFHLWISLHYVPPSVLKVSWTNFENTSTDLPLCKFHFLNVFIEFPQITTTYTAHVIQTNGIQIAFSEKNAYDGLNVLRWLIMVFLAIVYYERVICTCTYDLLS